MRQGSQKTGLRSELYAKQRYHLSKTLSIITLLCLLVQTVLSPISQYVNAEGNVLGISLSASSVNEAEQLVATLVDTGSESSGPLSFTVPEGLTISGIVEGQGNIETIGNNSQSLQFNWIENSSKVVKVQLQAQKAGDYIATFTSSDSSVSANVSVLASETETDGEEINQEETAVAEEETSQEPSVNTEEAAVNESDESPAATFEAPAVIAEEPTEDELPDPGHLSTSSGLKVNGVSFGNEDDVEHIVATLYDVKTGQVYDSFFLYPSSSGIQGNSHKELTGSYNYDVTIKIYWKNGRTTEFTSNHQSSASGNWLVMKGSDFDMPPVIHTPGSLVVTKVDENGNKLAGAEFTLKDAAGNVIATKTTGADGTVEFADLSYGAQYTVTETKAPEGYVLSEGQSNTKTFTIEQDGQVVEFKVINNSIKGSVKVLKTDESGNPLAGAEFTLYKAGTDEQVGEPQTTNDGGIATFEGLAWGDYYVKETKAPQGYEPSDKVENATVGPKETSVSVTVKNTRILGKIKVFKVDADNDNAPLQGAEFTLYKAGTEEQVGEPQKTNEKGIVTFEGLAWGDYDVKETEAPQGYEPISTVQKVTINQETVSKAVEVKVENKRISGKITVIKVDADNNNAPLKGAEFTLYKAGTEEKVGEPQTTNEKGIVTFEGLAWGDYDVKETKAPQGYKPIEKVQTITINQENASAAVEVKVENKRILGEITVTKVDADNDNAPLKGAEFTLYKAGTDEQVGEPKTTDEKGIVTFEGLAWGDYYVKETKAPQGYKLVTESASVTINQTQTKVSLTFTNKRILGTISVTKVDADNNNAPLQGAEFTLYKAGTEEQVGEPQTTNEKGVATFEGLAWGNYDVKETKAPQGYEPSAEVKTVTVGQEETSVSVTVENKRISGAIAVTKVDADNDNAPLQGAEFTLYKAGTEEQVSEPQTTNEKGIATFEGLAWGDYDVKETKAPQGYEPIDKVQKVTINEETASKAVEVKVENKRISGAITVTKVDADNNNAPLQGAEFTLYKAGTKEQVGEPQTTNKDGIAKFEGLAWGDYDVKETKAPQGYEPIDKVQKVTINQETASAAVEVTVENTRISGAITVTKVDADNDNAPLQGAEFTLYKAGTEEQVGEPQTTNEKGIATFEGLAWCDYDVKETKAPQGYEPIDKVQKVTINEETASKAVEVTVENTRILGAITVTKVDADNNNAPLKGAEFTLYKAGTDEKVGEPQTTDENGIVTFEGLAWGDYDVKETKAPQGYKPIDKVQKVTINHETASAAVEVTVENTRILGTITVTKVDADNDNAPLQGAEFTLYKAGTEEKVGEPQTTNKDGIVTFEGLAWGDYDVKETKAPQGYEPIDKVQKVTINQENASAAVEVTVENTRILGTITVTKVDADNDKAPLKGAEFTLYKAGTDKQVGEPQTTDENGIVTFEGLAWGDYDVKETKAPQGYKPIDKVQTVTINQENASAAVKATVENTRILGAITVTKVDADNDNAPLQGAEFTLYKAGTEEQVGEPKTTDEKGIVTFEGLAWGDYYVKETKAPQGYKLVTESASVTINQTQTKVSLTFTNKRILGTISVTKVDADNNNAPLKGAEFTLYKAGTDEQVGEPQTTNGEGIATFEGLAWGNYDVKETKAPQGYEPSAEVKTVTVGQEETSVSVTVENTRILGAVTVTKVDADNDNAPLQGAEFTLFKAGTEEQVGEPQTTNEKGFATFEGLAWGDYDVKETKAPQGYEPSDKVQKVTINQETASAAVKVTVENTRISGKITVTKVDADNDNAPLQGAEFTLYKAGTEEQVGEPQTTNKDGIVTFEGLAWGDYDVKETKAPQGYEPIDKVQKVTINQENASAAVEVTVENTRILGAITVTKVDADNDNAPLQGAEFTLYKARTEEQVGEPQTTNEKGFATFEGLAWGDYDVKETKAPQGYEPSDKVETVTINQETVSKAVEVTVENTRILGAITVTKVDADNDNAPLQGAEFTLYKAGTEEKVGEPQTTDEKGVVTFEGLTWGDYDVKETKAPQGYKLVTESASVTINQMQTKASLTFTNNRILGTITVTKVDADNNNAPLQGAEFTLYKAGTEEQVGEPQTTNEKGVVTFEGLAWGDYDVKETKAPQGYEPNDEVQTVTVGQEATSVSVNVENTRISGAITVTKVDAETGKALQGAEFTLYKAGTEERVGEPQTTNEEGIATFEGLAWGEYELQETAAPENYQSVTKKELVVINAEKTEHNVTIANELIRGNLIVTKQDADTGDVLSGAKFTVTQGGAVIAEGITDESGQVVFEGLVYGEYKLTEIEAPFGYLLPEVNEWSVSINGTKGVELTIKNTAEQPSLVVEKTADKTQYMPGETVTYTINVTNNGNIDLEGITLEDVFSKNDSLADQQLTIEGYEGAFDLAVNETASFTSTFVVPENDLADTTYKNVVTATTGDTTGEDEETVIVNPTYAFTIEKTADKSEATVGDTVTYSIVVTNTGNKALTNVKVTDDMIGLDTVIDQLEVNESKTLTGKYVLTAGDIGDLENIATATVDVDGNTITHEASAVVKVSAKVAAVVDNETPTTIDKIVTWIQNPKTGDATINTLLILFVFVLAGSGLYVYRRKHRG